MLYWNIRRLLVDRGKFEVNDSEGIPVDDLIAGFYWVEVVNTKAQRIQKICKK